MDLETKFNSLIYDCFNFKTNSIDIDVSGMSKLDYKLLLEYAKQDVSAFQEKAFKIGMKKKHEFIRNQRKEKLNKIFKQWET